MILAASAGPIPRILSGVLVVEPSLAVRHQLTQVLGRIHRHTVGVVATTSEARRARAANDPAVLLVSLSEESAAEDLAFIEETLNETPDVRIVLLTAEAPHSPIVRRAVRMGAFAVLPKPLRHATIRQIFQEIEAEDGGIERFA